MQCPNCGTENRDGAKFCDECGFPLGGALARAAIAVSEGKATEEATQAEFEAASGQGPERETPEAPHGKTPSEEIIEELIGENAHEAQPGPEDEASPRRCDSDAPDLTMTLNSFEENAARKSAGDATQVIDASAQDEGITRIIEEDDFAGFTKTPDDGFSFDSPLPYSDGGNPLSSQGPGFTMKMPHVDGEPKEQSRDFMASSTVPQKSHAKAIGIVAAVVVVVAVVAVATFMMGLWGGKVVPDVTGMTETDARAILEETGFTVRSTQVKSDDTEGLVLIMDPDAGTRVPESAEVVIHVASARLIPDIVGKTVEEAKALLAEAGYDNIRYDKVRHDGEENVVLSVEPKEGSRAKSYTEVAVGVSVPFTVPDISGLNWDDAFAAIEEAGLVPQVVYINTEYYPEGSIIGTTPEAGAVVSDGAYVSINIAQSRETLLTSLTQSLLVPGSTVRVGGYDYTIDALNSVTYMGNDTVAFSITGRPYVSLLGEVIHASPQTVNGQVVWSPSNEVVSIS